MYTWVFVLIVALLVLGSLGPVNLRLEGTWYDGLQMWEFEFRAVVLPVEMTPIAPVGGLEAPGLGE